MLSTVKSLPWWMIVLTGVLIVAAGIFLLVAEAGLGVMTFLLAVGVLAFGLYNIYKAFRFKDNNDLFVPFLVHGLLNLVLFLLIIVIHDTPALLGVILASWFIIFAVFGIIHARQDKDNTARTRGNAVMLLIGLALFIPLFFGINHVMFLGIVAIVIGVVRTAQGIIIKVRHDERTSGGRANLM